MRLVIILVYLFFSTKVLAQSGQQESLVAFGEQITITSDILNEERDIWVYLPPNYKDTYHEPSRYPVLYILDGDIHFHSVSGIIQILSAGLNGIHVIPEMILVAIPNTDRTRDLAPSVLETNNGPGNSSLNKFRDGTNFMKFIREEVIPKVDSSYRTINYRTFIGQSLGGLTVINMLLNMPETFNAYVAIEPSLWWDDKLLIKQMKHHFNKVNLSGKALFLAQANTLNKKDSLNVHYESIKEMLTILESRNQSKLRWDYEYYANDSHGSVALIAEYDALRFIFEKYYANPAQIFSPQDLKLHYKQISNELGISGIPHERVIQRLGRVALYSGNRTLAEEYFQMNIAHYPKSPSALDDMAKLMLANGHRLKALSYYKSALGLAPRNEFLIKKVKDLEKELNQKK